MKRHVTIKEVARRAGVGIATVSRVLNNSARVDPDTRTRVAAAIHRLGYRPNAQGRRLVKRATEMVCFVLSNREFMNPFHSGILCGAERFLGQAGQDVVFTSLRYSPETPAEALSLPRILTHRGIVDGVILAGTNYPNLLAAMDGLRVPYVYLGNNVIRPTVRGGGDRPGSPMARGGDRPSNAVYFEDRDTSRAVTEMLVGLGHKAIWFVGDAGMPWFRRRLESYRAVLQEHSISPREFTSAYDGDYRDYGLGYGEQATESILKSGQPLTAVFAGNDGIAYGVWKALRRHGMGVPGDVSLVGFDDVQEARLTDPPLTTVRVPTEEIGRACAQLLLGNMAVYPPRHRLTASRRQSAVTIPTEIVERGSCAPPGGGFSKQHSPKQPGRVSDLAAPSSGRLKKKLF